MTLLEIIVVALCVYRITRLVVADTFPPVQWLRDRIPEDGWGEVAHCGYCASVWIGFGVWAVWRWGGDLGHTLVGVGAVLGAAALLFSWEGE